MSFSAAHLHKQLFFPHEDVTGGISTICFLPRMRAICMTRHLRLLGKNQKRITGWEKSRELGLIVVRWAYQVLSNLRIFFFNLSPFCSFVPMVALCGSLLFVCLSEDGKLYPSFPLIFQSSTVYFFGLAVQCSIW